MNTIKNKKNIIKWPELGHFQKTVVNHAEIVSIEADSYRLKEARERSEQRKKKRKEKKIMSEYYIPMHWTPKQAAAVFEFVEDIRDEILAYSPGTLSSTNNGIYERRSLL